MINWSLGNLLTYMKGHPGSSYMYFGMTFQCRGIVRGPSGSIWGFPESKGPFLGVAVMIHILIYPYMYIYTYKGIRVLGGLHRRPPLMEISLFETCCNAAFVYRKTTQSIIFGTPIPNPKS